MNKLVATNSDEDAESLYYYKVCGLFRWIGPIGNTPMGAWLRSGKWTKSTYWTKTLGASIYENTHVAVLHSEDSITISIDVFS